MSSTDWFLFVFFFAWCVYQDFCIWKLREAVKALARAGKEHVHE